MDKDKIIDVMMIAIAGYFGEHDHPRDAARSALQALSSSGYMVVEGWRPIDTAPKEDGNRILGYGLCGLDDQPSAATVAWNQFYKEWWVSPNEASEYGPEPCQLTHWMPLPLPPQAPSQIEEERSDDA